MPDAHKNAAYSLVATPPSPASSGTSLVVTAGEGGRFPAVPFNATIWAASAQPVFAAGGTTDGNFEIVRVTGISTDTLTITRAQESTTARTVVVGDQIAATVTAKTLTDAEGSPAFATPAIVLGSAAAAGSAPTAMRTDDTIAAFDATAPTTQAFGDAAAVGTAAFAARRDHKHAMPANPVGTSWTTVTKGGDTARTSTTTVAADPDLAFTSVSAAVYEFEAFLIFTGASGTPDFKFTFAEDATLRGMWTAMSWLSTSDGVLGPVQAACQTGSVNSFGTATTVRSVLCKGWLLGNAGSFALYWSQATSSVDETRVKAGSVLRYRRIV